jgi:protein phosphatase
MGLEFDDEETLRDIGRLGHLDAPPQLDWAASTTMGRRRDNQDAWGERGGRFIVADGVGGTSGGKIASATAVSEFLHLPAELGWTAAVERINDRVVAACRAQQLPEAATTLVACAVRPEATEVIHVGDSRAYLMRSGELEQLTTDHSVGEHRRAHGRPVDHPDELGRNPSALISFIGANGDALDVSIRIITFPKDARLLLCSDGIHDQIPVEKIKQLLGLGTVSAAANALTQAADDAGGRDNATAVVIEQT